MNPANMWLTPGLINHQPPQPGCCHDCGHPHNRHHLDATANHNNINWCETTGCGGACHPPKQVTK